MPATSDPTSWKGTFTVLFDRSLEGTQNLSCGGNVEEYHYTGLNIERDCGKVEYHDFAKIAEGGICPVCGKKAITISAALKWAIFSNWVPSHKIHEYDLSGR